MGQKNSKGNELQAVLSKYTVKGKLGYNSPMGDGTLLLDKTTQSPVLLKEVTSNQSEDFARCLRKYNEKVSHKHPNVMQLLGFTSNTEVHFCSTFYKTYLLWEFSLETLQNELDSKRVDPHSPFFSIEEIWGIIEDSLAGLAYLQQKSQYHGDLRPGNIFKTANGYKVAEQSAFTANSSYTEILTSTGGDKNDVYLSPALMEGLAQQEFSPNHNIFKSDVFSFGVLLLYVSTLENCDCIYDYTNFSIDYSQLEARVQQINSAYSQQLAEFIALCLQNDEEDRPDFIKLLEIFDDLKNSEEEKKKQEEWVFNGAVSKLENKQNPFQNEISNLSNKIEEIQNFEENEIDENNNNYNNYENSQENQEEYKNVLENVNYNEEIQDNYIDNKIENLQNEIEKYEEIDEKDNNFEVQEVQENNYDFSEVNSLLAKYGIEPIQQANYVAENKNIINIEKTLDQKKEESSKILIENKKINNNNAYDKNYNYNCNTNSNLVNFEFTSFEYINGLDYFNPK